MATSLTGYWLRWQRWRRQRWRRRGKSKACKSTKALLEERKHVQYFGRASQAIRKVLQLVDRVAPQDTTVLILGESGTGKELVARALHSRSRRGSSPFVAINCAALSPALLESELFGHEKGAFTDASVLKKGKLELAEGGTVFLDEIGELAPELQAKLSARASGT